MAAATGVLTREEITAYLIEESGTGFISATNLETAANRAWSEISGTGHLIVDANRIKDITLVSPVNEAASSDTETVDVYGPDDRKTVSTTTDVEVDPIEFTAIIDFSDTTTAANRVIHGGADNAEVGSTKYLLGIVFKTSDTQQTALITVATLTRRQYDPAATGLAPLLLGFTSTNHKLYLVNQA